MGTEACTLHVRELLVQSLEHDVPFERDAVFYGFHDVGMPRTNLTSELLHAHETDGVYRMAHLRRMSVAGTWMAVNAIRRRDGAIVAIEVNAQCEIFSFSTTCE